MRGGIREEKTVSERRQGGEEGTGDEWRREGSRRRGEREDVKIEEKRGKQRRRRRSLCVFRVRAAIQTNQLQND